MKVDVNNTSQIFSVTTLHDILTSDASVDIQIALVSHVSTCKFAVHFFSYIALYWNAIYHINCFNVLFHFASISSFLQGPQGGNEGNRS